MSRNQYDFHSDILFNITVICIVDKAEIFIFV